MRYKSPSPRALTRFGPDGQAAVPSLVAALATNGEWVAEQAARALGAIGPGAESAIPALREAEKGHELLKKAAADALQKITGKAELDAEGCEVVN